MHNPLLCSPQWPHWPLQTHISVSRSKWIILQQQYEFCANSSASKFSFFFSALFLMYMWTSMHKRTHTRTRACTHTLLHYGFKYKRCEGRPLERWLEEFILTSGVRSIISDKLLSPTDPLCDLVICIQICSPFILLIMQRNSSKSLLLSNTLKISWGDLESET